MIKDLWEYDRKNVKLETKDGKVYNGKCFAGTDYETDKDYLDFHIAEEGTIHEIESDEIKSIEITK